MIPMLRKFVIPLLIFAACSSSKSVTINHDESGPHSPAVMGAVPFDRERVLIVDRTLRGCSARLAGSPQSIPLPGCPRELRRSGEEALAILDRATIVLRLDASGKLIAGDPLEGVVDKIGTVRLVRSEGAFTLEDGSAPISTAASHFESARLLPGRRAFVLYSRDPATLVRVGEDGSKVDLLPDGVREIDSVDVSPDGKEVVVSGRRDKSYDIALVSADGSEAKWVYPDVLDEVNVTWAPRGSKITYAVEAPFGTMLRSVHVPTSWQLAVDFPFARVESIVWEPKAEQFAVVKQGAAERPNVEMISFGGEIRKPITGSANVPGEVEPLGEGVLIRSDVARYNEKVPLVIVISEEPFRFREATSRLREAGSAVAILPSRSGGEIETLKKSPWVDAGRSFIISRGSEATGVRTYRIVEAGETSIVMLPGGEVRVSGPDADRLESTAADLIIRRIRSNSDE